MTRSNIREFLKTDGAPVSFGSAIEIAEPLYMQRTSDEAGHFQLELSKDVSSSTMNQGFFIILGKAAPEDSWCELVTVDVSTFTSPNLSELVLNVRMYPIMTVYALFNSLAGGSFDSSFNVRCWVQE